MKRAGSFGGLKFGHPLGIDQLKLNNLIGYNIGLDAPAR